MAWALAERHISTNERRMMQRRNICPLSVEQQIAERADLLLPIQFVPGPLAEAIKLTGEAIHEKSTSESSAYATYLDWRIGQPVWWLHFRGKDFHELAHALGASPFGAGWAIDSPMWDDLVLSLRGTSLDLTQPQWIPALPLDTKRQYVPDGLCFFADLYDSRVARAWRDIYGVEYADGSALEVSRVRPLWYEQHQPAALVLG